MGDHDPDALWRPGYTGPVVYRRAPPAGAPRPGRARRMVPVLAVIAVLAVAAGTVALRTTSGDEPSTLTTAPRLPAEARERWSVTMDARVGSLVAGGDGTIVMGVDGRRPGLAALDAASGRPRWQADLPKGRVESIDVLGDVVVAVSVGRDGSGMVVGVRTDEGTTSWTRAVAPGDRATVDAGQVLVIHASTDASGARLDLLDPSSGAVAASITGDAVSWSRAGVQRRVGDRIELADRASFRVVAGVDLAPLGLAGVSDVAAVATDAGVVVASPASVVLLDEGGGERAAVSLTAPVDGASRVRLDVLDPAGRFVAVQQGDHLIVLSTEGGALRELWSDSAWMLDWHVDEQRQLVATASVNGSVVAMPPQIVDAVTGDRLWDGPAAVQESSPLRVFGGDGFIAVTSGPNGESRAAVVGYDLDRAELWRQPLASGTSVASVDGAIVTVRRSPARTQVTLYS